MSDRFITIGRFSLLAEAQGARSRLAENNIPSWIIDDSVGGSLPGLGDTIGGVVLQVHEGDYDQAEAILGQFLGEGTQAADLEEARSWRCLFCDEEVDGDLDKCPSCGTARESIQTQPRLRTQSVAAPMAEKETGQKEPMEKTIGEVVQSRSVRSVIVALLLGPQLIGIALLILGLVVLLIMGLFKVW